MHDFPVTRGGGISIADLGTFRVTDDIFRVEEDTVQDWNARYNEEYGLR